MRHESDNPPQADSWDVTQCECGHLTLRLGTIRLDFAPEEFVRLHRLLDGAVEEFQVGAGAAPVTHSKRVMH
jgi:hypothetical protein